MNVSRTVEAGPDQWKQVAEAVYKRRLVLGLTTHDVVERSERRISKTLISFLENARQTRYLETKLRALSRALEWTDDSIELVLAGGEPTEVSPAPQPAATPTDVDSRLTEVERWMAKWEPYLDHLKGETDLALEEWDVRLRETGAGLRKPAQSGEAEEAPRRERRGA